MLKSTSFGKKILKARALLKVTATDSQATHHQIQLQQDRQTAINHKYCHFAVMPNKKL